MLRLLGLFASSEERTIKEFFWFKECYGMPVPRCFFHLCFLQGFHVPQGAGIRGFGGNQPDPLVLDPETSRFLKPLTDTMISVKQELCGGNQTFVISQNPQTQVPGLKICGFSLD